jgi:hypothetical protein
MSQSLAMPTWGQVARQGAVIGAQTAFSYAAVFGLVAVARAALTVHEVAPADLWLTAAAIGITLGYLVVFWSLLLALPAMLLGMATALIVKAVQLIPATRRTPRRAMLTGRLIALTVWPLLYVGLYALLRQRIAPVYLETFLFWYFMPGLIYLVLTGYAARRLAFGVENRR